MFADGRTPSAYGSRILIGKWYHSRVSKVAILFRRGFEGSSASAAIRRKRKKTWLTTQRTNLLIRARTIAARVLLRVASERPPRS